MVPRSRLPRQKPIKRSRVKKKPRSKSERERIYGPKGYVEWIHQQPCIACGVVGYSECAHIKTGGMGRKADWTLTIPLCGPHLDDLIDSLPVMGCHRWVHLFGFGSLPEFDPIEAAAQTERLWRESQGKGEC